MLATTFALAQIDDDHLMVGETAPLIVAKDQNGQQLNSLDILMEQQILLICFIEEIGAPIVRSISVLCNLI